jgi:hypothetical protein
VRKEIEVEKNVRKEREVEKNEPWAIIEQKTKAKNTSTCTVHERNKRPC